MDLMKVASELFLDKIGPAGSGLDIGLVAKAMKVLLPTKNGELDLQSLVGKFTSGSGLSSLVSSWLGEGRNQNLSAEQLESVFGRSEIESFANGLGIDQTTATTGLREMIPDLIDKTSEGGNLLTTLSKKASALFEKFF